VRECSEGSGDSLRSQLMKHDPNFSNGLRPESYDRVLAFQRHG
jgi:hypothetical protein